MQLGILGCGWLGERIADVFLSQTYHVYTTSTSQKKANQLSLKGCKAYVVDFSVSPFDSNLLKTFHSLDAIIISVKVTRNANTDEQAQIFKNIAKFLNGYRGKVILFTTTGIYPQVAMNIREDSLDESRLRPNVLMVEKIIYQTLPQVNILRLAGLMGDNRLLSHWYNRAEDIHNPTQAVNYVHYQDIIQIVDILLNSEIAGQILNVVAPEHPTKLEVFLGRKLGEPNQIKENRIINGQKLNDLLNYHYTYPNPINFI